MMTYEEFSKIPANRSVIPSSCESFAESTFYVAEAAQRSFNKFFEEVGITELAIFESTGTVIIYEGEKLNKFKEGFQKVLENVWASIKAAFEKIKQAFDSIKRESAKKLLKVSGSDVDGINDEKFNNTLGKFKYQKYKIDRVESKIKEVEVPSFDGKSVEEAKAAAQEFLDGLYGKLSGKAEDKDLQSMQDTIKEACKDGEATELTKEYLANNIAIMAGRTDAYLRDLGKDYRAEKAEFDKARKAVNRLKNEDTDTAQAALRCQVKALLAFHGAHMAIYDVKKAQLKQDLAVHKMVTALKNAKPAKKTEEKKEEVKQESANFIEEAFNW